jgi:hypothetical protein
MSHTIYRPAFIIGVAIVSVLAIPAWASESADHENCPHARSGNIGACCTGHPVASPQVEKPALAWETPEHWVKARPRPIREATYHPSGQKETECYVTVVAIGTDSAIDTLNRWRGQMGLPPVSQAEAETGPSIHVLGTKGLLLEAFGDFTDTAGIKHEDYGLLSIVSALEDSLLIVRMTGPREQVQTEREHFMLFLDSFTKNSTT